VRYTFAGILVLVLVPMVFGSVEAAAAGAAGLVFVLLLAAVSVAALVDRDFRQPKRSRDWESGQPANRRVID
jgi:predicted ABC-type exoprotein transport system permease subunit